jgi:hypothetical protein
MPAPARQKITFAEMRAGGVRGLLIYCSDYHCSHWTMISDVRQPDDIRLSDIEGSLHLHRLRARRGGIMPPWQKTGNRLPRACRAIPKPAR